MFIFYFGSIHAVVSTLYLSVKSRLNQYVLINIGTSNQLFDRNFPLQLKCSNTNKFLIFTILILLGSIPQLSGQDFLSVKKEEIKSAIANNDVNALEYHLKQVFLQSENYKKTDLIDFYLYRIKLYNAQAKYALLNQDLDSIFKYDSTKVDAYIFRIPSLKTAEEQLKLLQSGLSKVTDTIPLLKQEALIKIGVISNYWELNSYYGNSYDKEKAIKEIPYAQGGCNQLQQISGVDVEAGQLYDKKCFSEVIKNF